MAASQMVKVGGVQVPSSVHGGAGPSPRVSCPKDLANMRRLCLATLLLFSSSAVAHLPSPLPVDALPPHTQIPTPKQTIAACKWLMPWAARLMDLALPGRGIGLRLPSPFLRYVTFKLTLDLSELPALQSLVRRSMQALMSGDASEWDLAMQMPHYNSTSMPAVSLHTGAHFGQWSRDPAFRLFDHGSSAANRRVYGSPRPPSIAHNYRLLDFPVDLVAGTADRVVGVEDVQVSGWAKAGGKGVDVARGGHPSWVPGVGSNRWGPNLR